jgi:predicted ATPase
MAQRLEHIEIHGYKSIKNLRLELGQVNILIGSNGAGKTNFISVFNFLRNLIEQRLQITTRKKGGANRLLHYGNQTTEELIIRLDFAKNNYRVSLNSSESDGLFINKEEAGVWDRNYANPLWTDIVVGELESKINTKKTWIAEYTFDALRTWRVYHFHDTSENAPVKKNVAINDNEFLRADAANLAAFLYRLKIESPKHYQRIIKNIQLIVPMFRDFNLRPNPLNPQTIQLEWFDNNSDFPFTAADLSDGSLRFICIVTMLLQPNRPDLILLDEPELGLHPMAFRILAGLLKKVANFSQIIISTQSEKLVSEFQADDIIIVEHNGENSTFTRLENEDFSNWMKEYTLGELWEQNILGGRP